MEAVENVVGVGMQSLVSFETLKIHSSCPVKNASFHMSSDSQEDILMGKEESNNSISHCQNKDLT